MKEAMSLRKRVVASASYKGLSRLLYIIAKEVGRTRVKLGRFEDTGGYGRGSRSELSSSAHSDPPEGNIEAADFRAMGIKVTSENCSNIFN